MNRGVPTVREVNWLTVFPQLAVCALVIVAAGMLFGRRYGLIVGSGAYLAYSLLSRQIFAREHRRGIRLNHARRFEDAIVHFRNSYDFFSRHVWLDRFRWLFMLTPSRASYREMALVNEAFALVQLDRREEARAVYQRALAEFPDSPVAQTGLKFLGPSGS
jgi:hypothetical protein